jgi:hypothetical protein
MPLMGYVSTCYHVEDGMPLMKVLALRRNHHVDIMDSTLHSALVVKGGNATALPPGAP